MKVSARIWKARQKYMWRFDSLAGYILWPVVYFLPHTARWWMVYHVPVSTSFWWIKRLNQRDCFPWAFADQCKKVKDESLG